MGVYFTHKGDFNNVEKWFNSLLNREYLNVLSYYGQMGVQALRSATPKDTGLAATSWNYQIEYDGTCSRLVFTNDDIEGGCSVVILVDRGHATKDGKWVPGKHFINNALDPIIKQLNDAVWKEATNG